MTFLISLCNDIAVTLYGSVLAASFCDALSDRRGRRVFAAAMALLLPLQGLAYFLWDAELLQRIYPLTFHLPLALLLCRLTGKLLWPVFSVLTAYLCCELRRWIALLAVTVLSGGTPLQDLIELAVTVPLLLLLLHFAAPAVRQLSACPAETQIHICVIPALYYGFDYLTRIYTDLLQSGDPIAVEFMSFVCCGAYLIFLLYHSAKEKLHNELQQVQNMLHLQLTQAVREINALRESQTLTRQYRHDLRHHLQYLSTCLQQKQYDQAQLYIAEICEKMESQKVKRYCENEAANLILSAFAARAEKAGISMEVQGFLPAAIRVSDSDLCVLLSNALENALHACQPLAAAGTDCRIEVQFYERNGRLFLQVVNPCPGTVRFENGLPVSSQKGHGIGVQSICAVVQRYDGLSTFLVRNGQFILRLSL